MKKAAIQIAALAVLLLAVCVVSRMITGNTFTAVVPVDRALAKIPSASIRMEARTGNIVSFGAPVMRDGYIRVPVHPQKRGDTRVDIRLSGHGEIVSSFRVGRFGTIYDRNTGGFTGDSVALSAFTAFFLAAGVIMLRAWRQAKGSAFYAYPTIYAAGFSLFSLLTGLAMLYITIRHLTRPGNFDMLTAYRAITNASFAFMMATAPLMAVFAVSMAVSNVVLLRHERLMPKNVLGIGVSIALIAGEFLAFCLYRRVFSGAWGTGRLYETLRNVYATVFAYFECMLIGAIVCGIKAALHEPDMDADYILILGCRFRADGTLTPLLRGRVDKAIAFWRAQRESTGRTATLVPSGGRGADEPMAEAEAMRRYLLSEGVPEDAILPEDQSHNTYQNMAFSKALIDRDAPGAKVVYATTNYHVFRSGVWANLAGLRAEGMGSRTKWWYWPNAFMREWAGLLINRIPQELLLLLVLLVFFNGLSLALA